jgi:hypothetical protein
MTPSKPLTALALAGAIALSLLASACGGSAGKAGAKVDSRSADGGPGALVAFTTCMRRHGVPNFPDSKADSTGYHLRYGAENGIDPRSPQFKNAEHACRKVLPNGGRPSSQEQAAQLQDALRFAACIRSHGVPNFPDPKLSGNGDLAMGPGAKSNVNPSSPRFKAAEACEHLLRGLKAP